VTPLSYAKIVVRRIDTVTLKSFEGNDAETNRRRQRVAGKRQLQNLLDDEDADETPEEREFRLEQEELKRLDSDLKVDAAVEVLAKDEEAA